MAAVAICPETIKHVKRALQSFLPNAKSAAISESLARGLGYKSNAALRASFSEDPDVHLFEPNDFIARLNELSTQPLNVNPLALEGKIANSGSEGVFWTTPRSGMRVPAGKSKRERAWRSTMVAAVNEAIRRRVITVRPGDNRWIPTGLDEGIGFSFSIGEHPAYVHIYDAGFDELSVNVSVWPKDTVDRWNGVAHRSSRTAFLCGDLYASGWLERHDGAWLQTSRNGGLIFCRQFRLNEAANLELQRPLGFAVSGPFKM